MVGGGGTSACCCGVAAAGVGAASDASAPSAGTIRTLAPTVSVSPATQGVLRPSSLTPANTATSDPSMEKRAVRVPFSPRAERCSASRLPCTIVISLALVAIFVFVLL